MSSPRRTPSVPRERALAPPRRSPLAGRNARGPADREGRPGRETPPRRSRGRRSGCGLEPLDLLGIEALAALHDVALDRFSVTQRLEALPLDLRVVDEDVLHPLDRDEAVALLVVEPLDLSLR